MPLSSPQHCSSQSLSAEKSRLSKSGKVRFNLELAKSVADQIEDLQTRSNSETKTDVIRKALALFNLFIEEREAGTSIVFRRKNGGEETLRILI